MSVVIICGTKCALHSILEFHLLERYVLDICTAPGEQKILQIEITFLSSLHVFFITTYIMSYTMSWNVKKSVLGVVARFTSKCPTKMEVFPAF